MEATIHKLTPKVIQDTRGKDWNKGIRIIKTYTVMRNDTVYGAYGDMKEAEARADEISLSKGTVMTKEEGFVEGISTPSSVPGAPKAQKKIRKKKK